MNMHSDTPKQGYNVKLVVIVLLVGSFLTLLNQTLLSTALPHIMKALNIDENTAQWLTTVFLLVNGIMIPTTAFLIEKFSTRSLFLTAMGLFTAGTLLAAISPNISVLIIARIIQAAGSGILIPLLQTVMLIISPENKRGAAMGLVGLVYAFAPSIGPTLGGWIVDYLSWRYLFYMVFPISVIVTIFIYFTIKNIIITEITNPRVDILSIVLSCLGFGGLLYGFSMVGVEGWGNLSVIISLVVGVVSLIFFTRRQIKMERPLLEIRVLLKPMFTLGTILTMVLFVIMIGAETIIPLYIQSVRGGSALFSGLLLLPGAIILAIMSMVSGKLYDKVGAKSLSIIGFTVLSIGTIPFFLLNQSVSFIILAVFYAIRMFGISITLMPLVTASMNVLPVNLFVHGSAVGNTLRQVSASIGTALLVTIMSSVAASYSSSPHTAALMYGMNKAFLCAFIIGIIGVFLSFFINEKRSIPEGANNK
jgi:EmrB/QacA subfamily drug resistance transporter